MVTPPRALTVAGSDSGGGAGIQADLRTFTALGVWGTTVITAVTAQNTVGVSRVLPLPADLVAAQLDAVLEDIGADAAKTGMLATTDIVTVVAQRLRDRRLRLVVDPVLVSTSGTPLLAADALDALRHQLLPLAEVVTPNLPEARMLTGLPLAGEEEALAAARAIAAWGPRFVVIKGGHASGPESVDWLWDGHEMERLAARRRPTGHTHGSGCVFAAAIAARLACGDHPRAAIAAAKDVVSQAIDHAVAIGRGRGPVNPAAARFRPDPGAGRQL